MRVREVSGPERHEADLFMLGDCQVLNVHLCGSFHGVHFCVWEVSGPVDIPDSVKQLFSSQSM